MGSATTLVGLATYGYVPALCWMTEFVGARIPVPSPAPRSQLLTGVASPGCPMPVTEPRTRVPARLSQKMLLNRIGLLNSGEPRGRVAWSCTLFAPVDRPAGAGVPSLVTAVAVVTFFMIVLL